MFFIKRVKLLLNTFGLLMFFCCAVFAQERTWETFTSDNGDWSILAPGTMETSPDARDKLDEKGSYSYGDETGFFAVIYENSPALVVTLYKPFIGSHYKSIRKKFVKDSKGKLLKDEKFKYGNFSGREFLVQIPDGKILDSEGQWKSRYRVARFRVFMQGNRCYILMAVVPENEVNTASINNYFNSFAANK